MSDRFKERLLHVLVKRIAAVTGLLSLGPIVLFGTGRVAEMVAT